MLVRAFFLIDKRMANTIGEVEQALQGESRQVGKNQEPKRIIES
jgi:hypothetical protein